MKTNVLGYPRIGEKRELKKAEEAFWAGTISLEELKETGREIRRHNWTVLRNAGIDLIPSNDFSFYDQMLDMSLTVGAIPKRYESLTDNKAQLYFAMARGIQNDKEDIVAMEMTKWFDTNYHYIVPEFTKEQHFHLTYTKALDEFREAKELGITTKPVIIGPVTYLLLGKEKEEGFNRIDLLDQLLPIYIQLLRTLEAEGAEYIQIDEPCLVLDLDDNIRKAYRKAYEAIRKDVGLNIILTTYFEGIKDNAQFVLSLPVNTVHIDLVRAPEQIDDILEILPADKSLSLGIVDGRNIWKNDFQSSLTFIDKAIKEIGEDRIIIASSSSFLHVPYDLRFEDDTTRLPAEIKRWLAFAKQKVYELITLKEIAIGNKSMKVAFDINKGDIASRHCSKKVHDDTVAARTTAVSAKDMQRTSPYAIRAAKQQESLRLPLFPTTTIGSFPQTKEVRSWRSKFRKGELDLTAYNILLKEETAKAVRWQESIGLDVLVHGEFERNDMVEYFAEQLNGFAFTCNGWVQSYGSRCVKPPIIFGDISRPRPMTVGWTTYAQSLTTKPMKGMLTGPVTILEWSFVRNDQPRSETCRQIALAIRDEVNDLENAGIKIIQIDEPAIREGLPLRHNQWKEYLRWSVGCFRLASSGVKDETQIHTHMCYAEFNDIIADIAEMDADVITIECSRSQMKLLDVFRRFCYPNAIGPGVYDIHSARVPDISEMLNLLHKAAALIPYDRLWVNPDCGLKTRAWAETKTSVERMIEAAKEIRKEL